MKKKLFILMLAAIVAMALPVTVVAQTGCVNGTTTVANAEASTTTTSYGPGYSTYNYSVSEVLVPMTALEGLGDSIFSMQFKPAVTTAGTYFTNCEVYLANSMLSNLSAGWVQDTSLHLVYTGSLNYTTTNWQTITFDSAFHYTGGSLIVLVRRNHGSWTSGSSFEAYNAGAVLMRYAYQDSGPYTIGSLSGTNTTSTVPVYRFTGCYQPVTCAHVNGLMVTAVDSANVTLSWVDTLNSGATYNIYNVTDSTMITGVTDTFYTVTGLEPNTPYTFIVTVDCGGGDESSASAVSVRTACVFLDSVPYMYGFEGDPTGSSNTSSEFGAACWTRLNNGTDYGGYPYISSTSSYCHTGSRGLYWYNSITTGTYGDYQCLVLPGMNTSAVPINTLQLKFWAKASSTSYHPEFQVGVMTNPNDISTFEVMGTINVEGTTWTEYDAPLGAYTGTGSYVAIRAMRPVEGWYAYVDDITLDLMPDCPHPVNLVVDSVSSSEIHVHWSPSGSESAWVVTINDSLVADATTNSYDFSMLDLNTAYTITVAALCDNGDTSSSISVITHTLAGDPISQMPYFCGFEVTDDGDEGADWVLENGTQVNYWMMGTAVNNGGNRSLYITNDGSTNSYSTSTTAYVFAYATFQLDSGEYAYSYDWRANGESSYDFIRAAMVPNSVEFTAGAYCGFNNTSAVPTGGIAIDGAYRLNGVSSWQTQSGTFYITNPGLYKMVFMWRNDPSGGTMPPAAIDNIQLVLNTCPAPRALTATYVTSDSITVSWNAGGTETSWMITNGVDDPIEVTDSTYTFENLSPNTLYNIMVQAVCDIDDSSMWATLAVRTNCGALTAEGLPVVETFETQTTTSSSSPNFSFIPCWYRLDNGTSYRYPYISSSTTYNHTDGGSKGLYWYASTTTGTYGDYQILVLPPVDTNEVPINTLRLSFWAKPSSTSYSPVFYAGVMTDPTADSTFQYYDTINIEHSNTDWVKYTVLFTNFTGNGQYVALRANRPSSVWYAYVDDITLELIPPCPAVEDIAVATSATSAIVSWTIFGNSYTGAAVEYKTDAAATWTSIGTVSGDYAVITGLNPATHYMLRVTSVCGEDLGTAANSEFTTSALPCEVYDVSGSSMPYQIGDGTGTSYYLPVGNFYNYSYTQQLFTAEEIGGAMPITGIDFQYAYSSSNTAKTNVTIYLANVSANSLAGGFVPYNASTFVPVYTGSMACTTGWNHFNFDTTFYYDGSSNLLVVIHDNSGDYDGSSYIFYTHPTAAGMGRYVQNDSSPYTISTVSGGTSLSYRANVKFSSFACLQSGSCATPVAYVAGVTTTTADVVWAPGNNETSWNVYYRLAGSDTWTTVLTGTSATSYTFTGLASGMPYEFKIENACGSSNYHTVVEATTDCAAITSLPYFENFNGWGDGTGTLPNCWYRTGSYSTYTYISSSENMTGTTGGSVYMYSSNSASYVSWLIMPEIDTTVISVNGTQLVFNALYTSTSYGAPTFAVGVMSNPMDNSTFVAVDTVSVTGGINQWEVFEVSLANYTGNGNYVALHTIYPGTYFYTYLDDFTLEAIPTCLRPDSLTASNATTTTVDLAWNERGSATNWIVEYGPRGFVPGTGTGTAVAASSNPFTLTGLPVAYQGEYYVRSVCGAGDTGDYSRRPCAFGTSQIPATLPYHYDFENVAEWNNWQISSNSATGNWYRGTTVADSGSYSMYVANSDTGYFSYAFNAVVNAAAYRDVDFGPVDSSYTLTFRARVGGSTTAAYDGLMVFLVDPSLPTVASQSNITSPWGNVNDLYRIATVRLDTTWQTYTASFDTISGVHRVAFFWFNQNTAASYANIPQPAAVDNIDIRYSSCVRPVNLATTTVGSSTATLHWQGDASANYQVAYRKFGGSNMFTITSTNSVTLTGLESNSEYLVWVRKVCGVGDSSLFCDGTSFFTTMCENAVMATNFSDSDPEYSTGSGYSPIGYSLYNYSYVQTIIDSAQMAAFAGVPISAFGFMPLDDASGCTEFEGMDVYMANVSESSLSNGFIMPDATHVFVPVITNGNFNFGSSDVDTWVYHSFDTTFTWDGHSNVLFAVNRRNGSWQSANYFAAHTQTGSKMRYVYNDDSQYSINTVSGGTVSDYVGDITFVSCGVVSCPAPINLTANNVTYNSLSFAWQDADSAEVVLMQGTWDEAAYNPANAQISTTGTVSFTGLDFNTQYTIAVRQLCEEDMTSEWALLTVTTDDLPCFAPAQPTVTNVDYTSATFTWTSNGLENAWLVRVYNTTFEATDTVTAMSYTVDGLTPGTTYQAEVYALCGDLYELMSEASPATSFTTTTCAVPTGVTSSNITATSATISWTGTGATRYEVEYGTMGYVVGGGSIVPVNNATTVTLTGLEEQTAYDVYVRGYCGENMASEWSAKHQFTTPAAQNGIDNVDASHVMLYPNPASSTVTLTGIEGEATVTVVDMNGRTVATYDVRSSELRIDVSGYAKGAYFVRVTGEQTTAIRKLVVK